MAKVTTCDGLGVPIAEETPTTGLFGHQYCDEARPIAEEYLKAVDDLHTRLSEEFASEMAKIRSAYRLKLIQLPDES
jgi:hypothetical protein